SKEIWEPFRSTCFCLALIFLALGLMSKVMLVTLPFVMLLLDYWPLGRLGRSDHRLALRRLALEKAPFLLLGLAAGATTVVLHQRLGALTPLEMSPISTRVEN